MPETISIDKLRADIQGRVIVPDDPKYDEARTPFYGGIDRRPAVIVRSRTKPTPCGWSRLRARARRRPS